MPHTRSPAQVVGLISTAIAEAILEADGDLATSLESADSGTTP